MPYQYQAHYHSRKNFHGILGHGWEGSLNMRLLPHPTEANQVIFYDGTGRGDTYVVLSDGTYLSPESHFKKIVRLGDGSLLLRQANGTVIKFFSLDDAVKAGRLAAMVNRCGGRLTMEYNSLGQMVTVLDTLSRPITHEYDAVGHLVKIRDFAAREIILSYDNDNNLVAIRSPVDTDFPQGKSWHFDYTRGVADAHLNHNMIAITAPNEVAVGGPPFIVNYFDADDRLITQEWGGTGSSGIPAGGTVSYAREEVNQGIDPNNPELAREVVTVIDRNGNETVLSFNNGKHLIRKEQKTRGIRPGDPVAFVTEYRYNSAGLLRETIFPEGTRTVNEHDESNPDRFQAGNKLSQTRYPDARGADQPYLKIAYRYEPVYSQVWRVTEERGNDQTYVPQNGGANSPERYTTEYVPDYFEMGLDTPGCACGHTLREIAEMWDIDLTTVMAHLGQGDVNGDGEYNICGNTVLIRYPSVYTCGPIARRRQWRVDRSR